jgi:hypothetical protein
MSQIDGDPEGVQALKALASENRDYLKFLLTEAKTSIDHTVAFSSKAGVKYVLKVHAEGKMEVVRAGVPAP